MKVTLYIFAVELIFVPKTWWWIFGNSVFLRGSYLSRRTPKPVKHEKPKRKLVYKGQSIFWLTDKLGISSFKNVTFGITYSFLQHSW